MKEDLRVIRTTNSIENAFISLIEEKGFENVKMIDIAFRANVNRNTIYLHYETKEAIMEKVIERIFTNKLAELHIEQYASARFNKKMLHAIFKKTFEVIYENIEIYRIILTDQNLNGYLTSNLKKIKNYLLVSMKPTAKNEIVIEYIISGVFGIIQNWIIYDKGSVDQNVDMIVNLVAQNVRNIDFK